MDARQHRKRLSGVDRGDRQRRIVQTKIELAVPDRPRYLGRLYFNIVDIGETLGAQQLLRDVLGTDADAENFRKAH
jgi:hypothetical protein